MEILTKLLDLILEFIRNKKEKKIEDENIKSVQIETTEKIQQQLKKRKEDIVKEPKKDDFFNDQNW